MVEQDKNLSRKKNLTCIRVEADDVTGKVLFYKDARFPGKSLCRQYFWPIIALWFIGSAKGRAILKLHPRRHRTRSRRPAVGTRGNDWTVERAYFCLWHPGGRFESPDRRGRDIGEQAGAISVGKNGRIIRSV